MRKSGSLVAVRCALDGRIGPITSKPPGAVGRYGTGGSPAPDVRRSHTTASRLGAWCLRALHRRSVAILVTLTLS